MFHWQGLRALSCPGGARKRARYVDWPVLDRGLIQRSQSAAEKTECHFARRHARVRLPRRELKSTARSGILMLKVAPIVPGTKLISPPWARTNSAAIASPSPTPPARVEPWNAWNKWERVFSETPGPVSE